jgi:hypothetical protein
MVMTKQPDGVKRSKRAEAEIGGKTMATEYTITGEPPLVPEKTELGWTRRLVKGSVSSWEAHPAHGPDGKPGEPTEHADHTQAVLAIIEAYRASGAEVADTVRPAPAPAPVARTVKRRSGAQASRQEQAAKPAKATRGKAAAGDGKLAASKSGRKTKVAAAAADPSRTEAPPLQPTELIPVGPEHAGALDDASLPSSGAMAVPDPETAGAVTGLEEAVLEDPDLADAVAGESGTWDSGYPEPSGKHHAPDVADSPFAADASSPFADPPEATGFVR